MQQHPQAPGEPMMGILHSTLLSQQERGVAQLRSSRRISHEPFRSLLEQLDAPLTDFKVIRNLAHPDKPEPTRLAVDPNVVAQQDRIKEALTWIAEWLVSYELFLLTGKWLASEGPHTIACQKPRASRSRAGNSHEAKSSG